MTRTTILFIIVLSGSVFSGYAATCKPNTLQKCDDIVGSLANRQNLIGGSDALKELCRYNENVTNCLDDAVLRCPNLKDQEYETLIQVTTKRDKEACMNGSRIQQVYKKHEKCLSIIDENNVLKCAQDFIVILQVLKDSTEKEICCTFSQSSTCIYEMVLSECGNEAANGITEVVNLWFSPLVGPKCGTFNYTLCNMPQASQASLTPAILLVLLLNVFLLFSR